LDQSLFSRSLAACLIVGVAGGLLLIVLSILFVMNKNNIAETYTEWVYALVPRKSIDEGSQAFRRRVNQQRAIFGIVGLFGALLLVVGIISAVRHR